MQEEVNQKTVALSIRTTKLTGKVLAAALGKVVRALQKLTLDNDTFENTGKSRFFERRTSRVLY